LNKNEIKNKVFNIFSVFLNTSELELNIDTSPENNSEWDSLNHIKIIMELENTFNVEITPEDALEINSIKEACIILENKMN
jgi:acyl carrier protein